MKTRLIILAGVVIILILLAVFVYILLNKQAGQPFFPNFPSGEPDPGGVVVEPPLPPLPPADLARPRLRQLTTKPVAGYGEVADPATGSVKIHYVEAGEGYVYSIDLASTGEVRISNLTINEASEASFSPSGQIVAVKSNNQRRAGPLSIIYLNQATEGQSPLVSLDKQIHHFAIINDEELMFTEKTTAGLQASVYNLTTKATAEVFTIPFFEVHFAWGTSSTARHYLFNKPTWSLESYLYSSQNNQLGREPVAGFGLGLVQTDNSIFYSHLLGGRLHNRVLDRTTHQTYDTNIRITPEKCVASLLSTDTIWCGFDDTTPATGFPDTWYQGSLSFKDKIWQLRGNVRSSEILVDTFTESGRELDIINLGIGSSETALYFINKNDNTLWLYELND